MLPIENIEDRIEQSAMSPVDAWLFSKRATNEDLIRQLRTSARINDAAWLPLVVVVDDEPVVAVTTAAILAKNDLITVWFTHPKEALSFFESVPTDLLLTDFTMPHLDGLALSSGVYRLQPACSLFLLSGVAHQQKVIEQIQQTGLPIHVAAKPICPRRLIDTVKDLITAPPSSRLMD